ncbi:hypothetical protein AAG906_018376 [Vitis piasezkii]
MFEFASSRSPLAEVHDFLSLPPAPCYLITNRQCICYYLLMQQERLSLVQFWNQKMLEIPSISDFKGQHALPLARIKRIMKANRNVKMISADSQILFAKASELFILELTLRAWFHAEANKRRTLQPCDIGRAIRCYPTLHFLTNIAPDVHKEEHSENISGGAGFVVANDEVHFPAANHELIMWNHEIPCSVQLPPIASSEMVNKNAPKRGKCDGGM